MSCNKTMRGNEVQLWLPPGFRFHPTDEELVNHYLSRKCAGQPIGPSVVQEIDLYKFDPWELPELSSYGEKAWYFFSRRDRKYPNGSRPNRAAGMGYWKATGADKPIGSSLGIKKSLVFYAGKPPRGVKTNWIMHEYRLPNGNNLTVDDWVLCRIYNKKGCIERHASDEQRVVQCEVDMGEQDDGRFEDPLGGNEGLRVDDGHDFYMAFQTPFSHWTN